MTATEAFLENLVRSRLVPADRLAQYRQHAGNIPTVQIANQLVEQSLLTSWQAKMLLGGHTAFFLGKYELLDELGRGGMGAVFKARQLPIGRIVALKIMADKLVGNAAAVARFQREIRAAAAVNDPYVVAAFDAESVGDTHFLVMEYVPGQNLADILKKRGRLSVATACEYIRQAALGLAHAHEQGMVHRDIKPNNLLVTRDADGRAQVKILDLGLARFSSAAGDDAELTATGQVVGTPDYMSPEQGRNSHLVDIRSDIFSLGCTLFRALAGRAPFTGANAIEKLMARCLADAPRLETLLPEAPVGLPEVVARMLARDPAARYQTPREVAQVLDRFAAGDNSLAAAPLPAADRADRGSIAESTPIDRQTDLNVSNFLRTLAHEAELDTPMETQADAPPTLFEQRGAGPTARSRAKGGLRGRVAERTRADRRHRQWAALGTAIVLLLALGSWGWERTGRTRLTVDWPADERQEAEFEIDGVVRALPSQGSVPAILGSAGKRRLKLARAGYEPIEAIVELARGESKSFRPEWKPTPATFRRRKLEAWRRDAQDWLKKADGRLPATDDPDLTTLRRRFAALRPELLSSPEQPRLEALWRRLPGPLDFLKPPTAPGDAPALDPVLAPDQPPEFVAGFGDSRFKYFRDASLLIASPDGSTVATCTPGHVINFWNVATGRMRYPPAVRDYFGGSLAFSPEGNRAAWPSYEMNVWSLRDHSRICTLAIEPARVGPVIWTPQSNRVAVADNKSAKIHVFDPETGQSVADLAGSPGEEAFGVLAGSPDGHWLAAADSVGRTRLWNVNSGEGFDLPPGPTPPPIPILTTRLAFSPDSRQLVRGTPGNAVAYFDVHEHRLISEGSNLHPTAVSLSWNPDGVVRAVTQDPLEAAVWNVTEGRRQVAVTTRSQPHVRATLTQDGKRLVTSGAGGEVQVWDAETGEELVPVSPAITAAAVEPLGEWIALATNARTVEIREVSSGAVRHTLRVARVPGTIAISPDRRILAVASQFEQHQRGTITIFEDFRELKVFTDVSQSCSLTFTPDGSLLVAADWTYASAWSTRDWQLKFKRALPTPPGGYSWAQVAVTSDSKNLVVKGWDDSRGGIVGFSLPEGRQRFVEPLGPVHALTAAGDHRAVVLNHGNETQWIDIEKGKTVRSMPVYAEIGVYGTALAASPAAETFVSASSDGRLAVLETELLRPERFLSLGGTQLIAREVYFTPDGRHLVTRNSNGTVHILRLQSWPSTDGSP